MQCDKAVNQLLTPVERIEVQRYSETANLVPISAPAGASRSPDETVAVATSVAALFALILHPPLWAVPIAWALSALLYGSAKNQTESEIFAERMRQGEQTIDTALRQILPQASRAIRNTLQGIQEHLATELRKLWGNQLLSGKSVEQIETLCSELLITYQQFQEWIGKLSLLRPSPDASKAVQRAGRIAAADKETNRALLERILDEGRRFLWILDVHLNPQVVQWLENAYPTASLRILTAESHLNDTSVLLFDQAIRTLRQNRSGAVNMGILRDTRPNIDRSAPPFTGSWLLTERGSYYFSTPLSEVLNRSRDFDFETVTSDTAPPRRVTAETFEKWWFNRDRNLPMLPVFLKEQDAGEQGATT